MKGESTEYMSKNIAVFNNTTGVAESMKSLFAGEGLSMIKVSDGTLWEGQIALYFRWTCLPDCAVPELDADYRRNNRRLS